MSKGLYSFTLVVFSFLFSTQLHSQQKLTLESLVPPAPNAAELGKYGTIPVGTLTGVPEISFPLYEINTGKLKLPVTLSYHASGIQVNQKATDAGLGWSIMAGGQISRTVYGSPDDSYYGYFNYDPPSYETLLGITNYYTMQQYNNNPSYDLEPDLFVYNMGGRSGKFICKKDKSFMTIPFDPIKIQKNTDGQNKVRFQIVDDNGTIYQFNEYSNTNSDENVVRQTVSTWYLTAMISADLTDTISFVYDRIFIDDEIKQEVWPVGQGHEQGTYVQGSGQLQVINKTINYNELLIKKIIFKNGYVQFNRNTVRKDASITSQGCNSLDEMVVYNADNQAIKKITFNHNYFTATPFEDNWAHYRLKLTGFIESDPNATIKKEYKFDYDATALPRYNSYSVDYWGYYNGVSNSGLIPAATVYASEINSIAGTNWSPGQSWNIGNSNREPSATHMKAGILNKVTYPTGGYSLFDYEPHKYISDEYIKRTVTKEGRTNGIDKFTKSVDTFSIIYPSESNLQSVNPNSISANLNIYFSVSNMGNTDNADLITQRVTLINKTNNTIIKIWKHEGDLTIPNSVSEPITLWAGQTYEIKHEVYGNSAVYINSDITWSENTTQHPIKIGGGLRLKSVKSYTSDTMLAKEENYSYGTAEDGLGVKLFNEKKFYKNYEDVALDYFRYGAGSLMCVKYATYGLRKFLGISKYNSLNYMGSPILYSTVIKYEGTSASNIGKTVYNYNIVFDDTYAPDLFINSGNYGAINNAWHQGELTDETFYNTNS